MSQLTSAATVHGFKARIWVLLLALLCLPGSLHAQEALRQSLAGAAAAEAQHNAAATIGYYNIFLDPVAMRFSSSLGAQYNDNIHLSGSHREGDEIITPGFNVQLHCPVTQNNSLDVSFGVGYMMYVNNSDLNQYYITPGSGLNYNVYIGDFVVNLHDRLSVTENGYQNPTSTGNGNNSTLNNTAGTAVTWDLNKLVLNTGYDHGNYVNLNSTPGAQDSSVDNVFLSGGVRVLPELTTGLEAGGSSATYSGSSGTQQPDTKQWSVGAFGKWQVSEYISTELHAGYSEMLPQNTSTNTPTSSSSGMYFGFSLTHRVNQWMDYTFTADRSQNLQSYGQPYTTYNVNWTPNWRFLQKYTLSTPFWWQHGTQFYSQSFSYDQYGAGVNLSRQITQKLSGSLSYQYVQETSDQGNLNYTVNIIGLSFTYQF